VKIPLFTLIFEALFDLILPSVSSYDSIIITTTRDQATPAPYTQSSSQGLASVT
jgi:hypothetical protein